MVTSSLDIPVPSTDRGRSFYTGVALVAAAVALAGFARTYYLKVAFGTPELTALKHLHGLVMTSWLVVLVAQVRLVATGRTHVHRKVGMLGVAVAALLVFVGTDLALTSAREGFTPLPSVHPLVFLIMPLGEMVTFVLLVGAAIAYRRKPAVHKRLMLVATLAMLTPAMARLAILAGFPPIPPLFFGMTDLVILACIAVDWRHSRRVHPAFVAALATVVVVQAGRLALSQTDAWMQLAKSIVA